MKIQILSILFLFLLSACAPQPIPPTATPTQPPTNTTTPSPLPTETKTPTPTFTPTFTTTPTETPTPTQTFTPIPTYVILRGEVNAAHVNCYYGPGKAYLYKYGLVGGSNLEIIGRNVDTGYILVQAIGGNNPCWMNSEWMNIRGELEQIKPIPPEEVTLPLSPYYGPPSGQAAVREGNQVIITWNWFGLRAGDDSLQYPYLVEAWVCRDGSLTFIPAGSWVNTLTIVDEAGCTEPSHGRLYAVEKHGYPPAVEILWPHHPDQSH